MPPQYRVRAATLNDIDALVEHRVGMFADMGRTIDRDAMAAAFRAWLVDALPAQIYLGWVVETGDRETVAGAGLTLPAWPPGPQSLTGRIAFVYNVYTAPPHRSRGVARLLMETIHQWCREHGVDCVRLNASQAGQSLYESLGYRIVPSPTLQLDLEPPAPARPPASRARKPARRTRARRATAGTGLAKRRRFR